MAIKSKLELKVGIFVFIALSILVLFVLMIGDFRLINPGYRFKVSFGFANGVTTSAPVRLSGVEVGEVRGIEIVYDQQARKSLVLIDVWVKKEAKIPADSRVWVNMLGLLGEKYIEVYPSNNYQILLTEGSIIKGEDPVSIQELTDLSREVALQVNDTVKDVADTLNKLDVTLVSLNAILENVKDGRGTVGKLFFDEGLYDSLDTILENIRQGRGTVGKLFSDDKLYNDIEEMFSDLKKHPWKLLYRSK